MYTELSGQILNLTYIIKDNTGKSFEEILRLISEEEALLCGKKTETIISKEG